MDVPTLVAQWSGKTPGGLRAARQPPSDPSPRVLAQALPEAGGYQEGRDLRPRLPAVSRPAGRLMPQKAGGACRRKAGAGGARTGSGSKATSSASGAATIATPSAPRSVRTPSTPQPSTSSRPSPRPGTAQATSTWAFRRGTPGRSLCRLRHTGRRCRIRNRGRNASGRTRCGIRVGDSGSTSCRHGGASAAVGALSPSRRSRKPSPARSRPSRATGTVGAADLYGGTSAPPRWPAGWRPGPLQRQFCAMTR